MINTFAREIRLTVDLLHYKGFRVFTESRVNVEFIRLATGNYYFFV